MERRAALRLTAGTIAALGAAPRRLLSEPAAPAPPRFPPHVETADGTRLFVRSWGTGKPVVFLHAWGLNADSWQYQMVPLSAQGLQCVAYDRRGHGRSSDSGTGLDADTLADDLASVLKAFDLRDVTLVAHSFGAADLVRYVTRHRAARVTRLVLVATAPTPFRTQASDNPDGAPAAALEQLRQTRLLRDLPKTLREAMPSFLAPDSSPAMLDWLIGMIEQTSLKALVDAHRAAMGTDFRDDLRAIRLPTLVIHGDKDTSAPIDQTGRRTAAMIPGAKLVVYEGAPHGIPLTHVERLTTDILRFVLG
jgi:non-heme chloroperoxidase